MYSIPPNITVMVLQSTFEMKPNFGFKVGHTGLHRIHALVLAVAINTAKLAELHLIRFDYSACLARQALRWAQTFLPDSTGDSILYFHLFIQLI